MLRRGENYLNAGHGIGITLSRRRPAAKKTGPARPKIGGGAGPFGAATGGGPNDA